MTGQDQPPGPTGQVAWSTEEPKGAYINTNLLVPEGKLHGPRRSERGFFTHTYILDKRGFGTLDVFELQLS